MSEPAPRPQPQPDREDGLRYLPVPVERAPVRAEPRHPLERVLGAPPEAVAAAGGFLAGVAAFVLVRVLRSGAGTRAPMRGLGGRRGRGIEVAGSRSFLVDVHLLKR